MVLLRMPPTAATVSGAAVKAEELSVTGRNLEQDPPAGGQMGGAGGAERNLQALHPPS